MQIYFDSASTTFCDSNVLELMSSISRENISTANPLSSEGRRGRMLVENARKRIAELLNVRPSELIFTNGAADANKFLIEQIVFEGRRRNVITSPIEHLSVLRTLNRFHESGIINLKFVKLDSVGQINFEDLELLLQHTPNAFVCLMHANNEISNLLPVKSIAKVCEKYGAFFHSDMAQTIGRLTVDIPATGVHTASFSAHKFHGPGGVGALFVSHDSINDKKHLFGDFYLRSLRGTQNVAAVCGLALALENFYNDAQNRINKIKIIKNYMIERLNENADGIHYFGQSKDKGIYDILAVGFAADVFESNLRMALDVAGITVSGGASSTWCIDDRSHVFQLFDPLGEYIPVRFSFDKHNTKQEVDYFVDVLAKSRKRC